MLLALGRQVKRLAGPRAGRDEVPADERA